MTYTVGWHWDRYVSVCRRIWRGQDCSHIDRELVHHAECTNNALREAGLNPVDHLRLVGER